MTKRDDKYQLENVTLLMFTEHVCDAIRIRFIHLTTVNTYHLTSNHTINQSMT